jgi:hypothetical protein
VQKNSGEIGGDAFEKNIWARTHIDGNSSHAATVSCLLWLLCDYKDNDINTKIWISNLSSSSTLILVLFYLFYSI